MQPFRMIPPHPKTKWSIGLLLGTVSWCSQLFAQAPPDSLMLFDFEAGFNLASVQTQDAEIAIVDDNGNRRLKINTGDESISPGIVLNGPKGGWDLNGYHHVKLDITNAGDHLAHLVFKVGDPEDGMEAWQMEIRFDLETGETKTVLDDITTTPWVFSPLWKLSVCARHLASPRPTSDRSIKSSCRSSTLSRTTNSSSTISGPPARFGTSIVTVFYPSSTNSDNTNTPTGPVKPSPKTI